MIIAAPGLDLLVQHVPAGPDGAPLTGWTAGEWRLLDEQDAPLSPWAAVPAGAALAFVVPGSLLPLAPGDAPQGRSIALRFAHGGRDHALSLRVVIAPGPALVVPTQSWSTLREADALAVALDIADAWTLPSEAARAAALRQAHIRICRLRFSFSAAERGEQDRWLGDERVLGWGFERLDLSDAKLAGWLSLPGDFRLAVREAQVLEAASILSGDRADADAALAMSRIGETEERFQPRPVKKLRPLLCPAATERLSRWMSTGFRLGRG